VLNNVHQAYPIADDILYNILHDIVLKTHREERIARSLTAGIAISKQAAALFPPKDATPAPTPGPTDPSDPSQPPSAPSTPRKNRRRTPRILETDAALYDNGIVTLKGNPLLNVQQILCPKCGKEKLLYPTTGKGAREPVPGVEYCERQPWVDKEGCDIYGLPYPRDDVSASSIKKSQREKEKEAKLLNPEKKNGISFNLDIGTDSSFENNEESTPPPAAAQEERKMVFPNVSCPRCPRMVNVRVFDKHLNSHLRSGGRASGRAAAMKISAESQTQSQDRSRKGTPATSNYANPARSPLKRDRENGTEGPPEKKRISLNLSNALKNSQAGSNASSRSDKDARSERSNSTRSIDEQSERDRERARILQREKDKQREREIQTNNNCMAAKRRWLVKVVKKWKSGKVTVDGRLWEPRE